MGKVLSIDLAYRKARDFGISLLEDEYGKLADVQFIDPEQFGLTDPPDAESSAERISAYGQNHRVEIVLLDGPQGWKDPQSALKYRCCERVLNAMAKVGIQGQVKPRNFTGFVQFSVSLFTNLITLGGELVGRPTITVPPRGFLLVESYPRSA